MITIDPKVVTPAQLRRAADILDTIDLLGKTFRSLFTGQPEPERPSVWRKVKQLTESEPVPIVHKKGAWTPERHAKFRATLARKKKAIAPSKNHPKRSMSAAARAKISRAAKQRWATAKAAGRNSL